MFTLVRASAVMHWQTCVHFFVFQVVFFSPCRSATLTRIIWFRRSSWLASLLIRTTSAGLARLSVCLFVRSFVCLFQESRSESSWPRQLPLGRRRSAAVSFGLANKFRPSGQQVDTRQLFTLPTPYSPLFTLNERRSSIGRPFSFACHFSVSRTLGSGLGHHHRHRQHGAAPDARESSSYFPGRRHLWRRWPVSIGNMNLAPGQ